MVSVLEVAIMEHADSLNFERAAQLRDGVSAFVDGAMRAQRLDALARCAIVAARPVGDGWDVAGFAEGALVGSEHVSSGVWAAADRLRVLTQSLDIPQQVLVEERELVSRWIEAAGTRLLYVDGEWSLPVNGAGRHRRWVTAKEADRASVGDATR